MESVCLRSIATARPFVFGIHYLKHERPHVLVAVNHPLVPNSPWIVTRWVRACAELKNERSLAVASSASCLSRAAILTCVEGHHWSTPTYWSLPTTCRLRHGHVCNKGQPSTEATNNLLTTHLMSMMPSKRASWIIHYMRHRPTISQQTTLNHRAEISQKRVDGRT